MYTLRSHRHRIGLIAVLSSLLLSCLLLTSCFVPYRTDRSNIGVAGIGAQPVDLNFLEPGLTSRDEVLSKLAFMNAGVKSERIFWGRWSESKWAYVWFAAGGYNAAGGSGRMWHRSNIILQFNENGVLQQSSIVPDKQIETMLARSLQHHSPLDLTTPASIDVEHVTFNGDHPVTLGLGRDTIEFADSKHQHQFKTSRDKVAGLTHAIGGKNDEPQFLYETLRFTERTKAGRKVVLKMSPASFFTLLQYLETTKAVPKLP